MHMQDTLLYKDLSGKGKKETRSLNIVCADEEKNGIKDERKKTTSTRENSLRTYICANDRAPICDGDEERRGE